MAAAARSFDMGTVVHMLISSMANRSSQYFGGEAGKWLCMDSCSVGDAVLADILRNIVSEIAMETDRVHRVDWVHRAFRKIPKTLTLTGLSYL